MIMILLFKDALDSPAVTLKGVIIGIVILAVIVWLSTASDKKQD